MVPVLHAGTPHRVSFARGRVRTLTPPTGVRPHRPVLPSVRSLVSCKLNNRERSSSIELVTPHADKNQHLAFLPGRDPSHALCVKVGGDRPSFDPPQCVNVGATDRHCDLPQI